MDPLDTVRPRRHRLLTVLLWFAATAWAGLAGWRLWGYEANWPLVLVMPYTPYLTALGVVPIVVALWRRLLGPLTILVIAVCALTVLVMPRWFADSPVPDGPGLRVMSANLMVGATQAEAVVRLVRDHEVDLLAVQELTPAAARALADSGMAELLPHHLEKPDEAAAGAGIYSRYPITEAPAAALDGIFWMPAVHVEVPDIGTIEFVDVHIAAPASPERMPHWRDELAAIPAATDSGPPRILAGDFNATVDHRAFRDLLDSGHRDAALSTGDGFSGTWSQVKAPAPLTLDHVLTDRRAVATRTDTAELPGSDHRALIVDLVVPDPN